MASSSSSISMGRMPDLLEQLAKQMRVSKQQLITNIVAAGLAAVGLAVTVYALQQQQPPPPPPPPPPTGAKLSATLSSSSLPEGSTTPLTIDVSYTKQDNNNNVTPLPNYELYMKVYNASSKEDVTATVSSTGSQIVTARTDSNGKARFTLYVSALQQGQYTIVISDNRNELQLMSLIKSIAVPPL
ncbi:MAG: hypothetical protein QXI43_00255 [Candidatus Nitrosocaldus sp.]